MIKNYGGAYQRCRLGIRIYQNSKINEKKKKKKKNGGRWDNSKRPT